MSYGESVTLSPFHHSPPITWLFSFSPDFSSKKSAFTAARTVALSDCAALDHVGELLASAQLILRACDSQVEIFPAKVDPDEIHHERAARVGELTVAHSRCQLVGDDCIPMTARRRRREQR